MRITRFDRFTADLGWRLALGALAVILCAFSVEVAVHSVHHLDEPEPAAVCAVFAGSLDTETACPADAVLVVAIWHVESEPPVVADPCPAPPSRRVPATRAPPSL